MASITEISIKRPLLITVVFTVLVLFGGISYTKLNYNLLPKFELPLVLVQTVYPGASAEEVENSVTKLVEDATSSLSGLKTIAASSRENVSIVLLELLQDADATQAQLDAERKISSILKDLPQNAEEPVVLKFSLDDLPVITLSASSNLGPDEMYDLIDRKVKPLLTNVSGVAQVNIIGGQKKEIEVRIDNDKLAAYYINPLQIQQLIANAGLSFPAGNIEGEEGRFSLRLDAKLDVIDDLKNIVIRQKEDGSKIYLKDVATISEGIQEAITFNRINGVPGVGIEVIKQNDANTVEVAQGVRKQLELVSEQFADTGFTYEIAGDQSIYTLAAANSVIFDLFLAIIIVAIVMVFFLHSIRSSSFVLVAIPSAMIPTFIMMWAMGFTLNLMTLMALSLVVGILVDDSIVVLENIYRHLEMGKPKRQAALEGRNEIGFTAVSITLVDVVVFIPLALTGGLIGDIIREFSLVIVTSTLMSLTVAFTLTPMMASRWGKLQVLDKNTWWGKLNYKFESIIDITRDVYVKMLRWALQHKVWLAVIITTLFLSTVAYIPLSGLVSPTFIQPADRGELNIQIDLPPETKLTETNQVVSEIESMLLQNEDVVKVFSNIGTQTGEASTKAASTGNIAEISVFLTDKNDRDFSTDEFGLVIRDSLLKYAGMTTIINPVGVMGNDIPIQVIIKGTDYDSVQKGAKKLFELIKEVPGTDYIRYSTKAAKKDMSINIDRDKAALHGLSVYEIGGAVQLAFQGNNRTKFKDRGEEYDINITLDKADKTSLDDVKNLTLQNQEGQIVRLSGVADIEIVEGQAIRERTDRLPSMKIMGAIVNRPLGDVINDIKAKVELEYFPEGTEINYLGPAENMNDSILSLSQSLVLGVLLIYFVMVALYEDLLSPFIVLFSIPVSFVGAFLALGLTLNELSIFVMLGLIMLLGLVAKNAILLVDFANIEIKSGKPVVEALVQAGEERLRPIMMTTFAMIFGMLPIALASGDGAEIKNGMAWVILGGLASSMVLTVFLVPAVYYMFYNIKEGRHRRKELRRIRRERKGRII